MEISAVIGFDRSICSRGADMGAGWATTSEFERPAIKDKTEGPSKAKAHVCVCGNFWCFLKYYRGWALLGRI